MVKGGGSARASVRAGYIGFSYSSIMGMYVQTRFGAGGYKGARRGNPCSRTPGGK